MKKRMLALAMILILVLTSTVFAYAEEQSRETMGVTFSISRVSRTSAAATVDVTFVALVDSYNVTIYLQKKVDGRWVSDVANEDYVYSKSGVNAYDYMFNHIYTNLEANTNYRLKCVSRDTTGTNTYSTTTYSNQF
ncbi:MAG: hypothetical protein IKT31_06850 [Firmicutes bacterium]|nr:hypothetical protein [Bacillota bacterium]